MKHRNWTLWMLGCGLAYLLLGCMDVADDDDGTEDQAADGSNGSDDGLGQTSQDIIGGYATFTHPDVGLLHVGNLYCTGTLITHRLVLTAAHCVGYHDQLTSSRSGTFTIQHSKTAHWTYHTTSYLSYGGVAEGYANDIALIRLETAVPATVAAPYHAGHTYPADGAQIAVYGYGDTNPFSGTGFGTKRRYNSTWLGTLAPYSSGLDFVIAEGDSGGPVMSAATGIIGVSSRYYYNTSTNQYYDYFAYVTKAYPWIVSVVKWWG